MAHPLAIAALTTGLLGGGAVALNSVGSSPETLPDGCSYAVDVPKNGSWYGIAEDNGITVAELTGINESSVDEVLHPGDKLCTVIGEPGVAGSVSVDYSQDTFVRDGSRCLQDTATYSIKMGDGPYAAASFFGLSLENIYGANPGLEGSTVYEGDVICSVSDLGDADFSGNNDEAAKPLDELSDTEIEPSISCRVTADIDGDGDSDNEDVREFQNQYNKVMDPDIAVDGVLGEIETCPAIEQLQLQIGTKVDRDWGRESQRLFKNTYAKSSSSTPINKSGVREGCEPYHSSTQMVLCGSAGNGNEPVELYVRGDDGNMYLDSSANGRSSRYDSDGPEGGKDCITPREHKKLDKSSMQEKTSKGLRYFIPFGTCGGDGGTGFHYYPLLSDYDDSSGCFRTPHDFIKNVYIKISNGGQTEVKVRDK